jgi:hypothetical protein
MSYTKNILLDRAMQEQPHGFGISPAVPFMPTSDELAQIEREQHLQQALESVQTMKEFWQSGDRVKMAFAMKFCADVQEWLNYLYFDSDFLSFGSDEGFASPEPDWDNEVQRSDDRMWEVCHA